MFSPLDHPRICRNFQILADKWIVWVFIETLMDSGKFWMARLNTGCDCSYPSIVAPPVWQPCYSDGYSVCARQLLVGELDVWILKEVWCTWLPVKKNDSCTSRLGHLVRSKILPDEWRSCCYKFWFIQATLRNKKNSKMCTTWHSVPICLNST